MLDVDDFEYEDTRIADIEHALDIELAIRQVATALAKRAGLPYLEID